MGMHLAVAGIDHQPLHVRLVNDLLKQSLPNTPVTPAAESPMGVLPVAITGRKVAPGCAGTQNPENGIKETAIVVCDAAPLAALPGKVSLKEPPSGIRIGRAVLRFQSLIFPGSSEAYI